MRNKNITITSLKQNATKKKKKNRALNTDLTSTWKNHFGYIGRIYVGRNKHVLSMKMSEIEVTDQANYLKKIKYSKFQARIFT